VSNVTYGPVTTALQSSIAECEEEVGRLREMLSWSWLRRYQHQVSAREVRRCIAANEERIVALRHAVDVAIEIEGWTSKPEGVSK